MSATALPAQPLRGRRIAVTRARRQAAGFAERLEALGAEAILLPMIRVEPAEPGALRAAAAALDAYDWVVFTSVNGVDFFWPHLEATRGGRLPATTRVAAIGPATAQALRERGSDVDFVPEAFVAEALAERLPDVAGRRILLPRADIARPALADGLRARGAVVTDLAAYRTVAETPADGALAVLREGIDVVTFTSSSTVRHFLALLGDEARPLLARALVACIGPITARTCEEEGLAVGLVAETYTLDGLLDALVRHFCAVPASI